MHIVMFKFKAECQSKVFEAKNKLEALIGVVPSLLKMKVGVNFDDTQRAMDLSLYSLFENEDGLKEYTTHPAHVEVRDFLVTHTEYSKVCDYRLS